jgi:hypothetical protein
MDATVKLPIIKTIGDEKNLLIKDCPMLLPKENVKIFSEFSKATNDSAKKNSGYGNSYNG